jgi:branched-chain amino acid transport system substrate-binding protein
VCTAEGDPGVQGFYADYNAEYGKDPSSYVAVIGYDEVNILKAAIEQADSAEPADIVEALKSVDYTGISGHAVMDPSTRRVEKPAAIVQMDGTTFTCLPPPPFPSYVPNA